MMEFLRQWLTGVTAVAVVLYIVRRICPGGAVGKAAEFAAGLILLGALLRLPEVWDKGETQLRQWRRDTEKRTEELERLREEALLAVIEEETAAYIWKQEPSLEVEVTAEMENGTAKITSVELQGPYDGEVSRWIAEELGAERQVWHDGET